MIKIFKIILSICLFVFLIDIAFVEYETQWMQLSLFAICIELVLVLSFCVLLIFTLFFEQ